MLESGPLDARHAHGWDLDGVAERVDELWQESVYEEAHVDTLGALCARYLRSRELRVLDVGCGTGRIHERIVPALLPERGYSGIDSSARMLRIGRRRLPGARLLRGDGTALPFADRSFDLALAFEVAGHLPALAPLVRELGRVSRQRFLFTTWTAAEEEGVVDETEMVHGVAFLHRRYPVSAVLREIAGALPAAALEVEVAVLHGEVWAYAVTHTAGTTPGVRGPRFAPIAGFGQRLLERAAAGRHQP